MVGLAQVLPYSLVFSLNISPGTLLFGVLFRLNKSYQKDLAITYKVEKERRCWKDIANQPRFASSFYMPR